MTRDTAAVYTDPPPVRRRHSRDAKVVAPAPALRVPRAVRRLRRNAPMYAIQGLSELSMRLRELTGREIIDMNRVMELVQFAYQQQQLAKRGANYVVDDFGFDAEWTESFTPIFRALYRDYWRVATPGMEIGRASCREGGWRGGGAGAWEV